MRCFLSVFCLISAFSITTSASAETPDMGMRLMVFPFENMTPKIRSQDYLSLGLADSLAERLSVEPRFVLMNGDIPALAPEAAIVHGGDIGRAAAVASAKGATHIITGRFGGQVWDWKLTVVVYAIDGSDIALAGTADIGGDQTALIETRAGRKVRAVSSDRIQKMLAAATELALSRAGLRLAPSTAAALLVPPASDSYAAIQLARAYERYFRGDDDDSHRGAIGFAEYAVRIDPSSVEARRFYARLLEDAGKPGKARIHYEAVLGAMPDDLRSLVRLGRIEVAAGNFEEARVWLRRAVAARPDDPAPRFSLGLAYARMRRPTEAITEFEAARRLDPSDTETRRQLAVLYQDVSRHGDAASELRVVVDREPGDLDSVFGLAACLRRFGDVDGAIEVYRKAESRFPPDARFPKFRGDLLRMKGGFGEARAAYESSAALDSKDARAVERLAVSPEAATRLIGGPELVVAIAEAREASGDIERDRAGFQAASNDSAIELALYGKTACDEGRPASAAELAEEKAIRFAKGVLAFDAFAAAVRKALAAGEGVALTSDELRIAEDALASADSFRRDAAEMREQHASTVGILLRRYGCGDAPAATEADIEKRNRARYVALPDISFPSSPLMIAPEIRPATARAIRFRVDNTDGRNDLSLVLDGILLGRIPAGSEALFAAGLASHRLCLLSEGETCEARNTRNITLNENLTLKVRSVR